MLKRLIDFVAKDTSTPPFKLTLQDVTLCQLWYDEQLHQGAQNDQTQAILQRINAWLADPPTPDLNTAGRRHQRLLRLLMSHLATGDPAALSHMEIAFLCEARKLVEKSKFDDLHARFREQIAPYEAALQVLHRQVPSGGNPEELERHIMYATEADIQQAETSAIRLLAGIEIPSRGPIFKSGNNLRILGDVPENCTVVVENEGSCSVDGYVMGRILTKNHCEIRHNISGVAIVLHGYIRARSIINNALVVSKMGSVLCINAQGPKLIFAGQLIDVRESTMLGKYVTRNLHIGGEARGSHIEITGEAEAKHFRHLGMRNLVVVLRRELSCEDFGEITGDELKKLLSKAYALRQNAHNFRTMSDSASKEADHMAQSVLMYIFGGGEVQKRLQGLLAAQRRHTIVSNIVDNLQNFLEQAQYGLTGSASDVEDITPEVDPDLDDTVDEELEAAQAEAEKLRTALRTPDLDQRQTTLFLEETRHKLYEMRELQKETAQRVKEVARSLQNLEKYDQVLAGSGEESTKIDVLNRILPAMRKQAPDSTMGKRLRSSFIARSLRTIDRATRHTDEFGEKADRYLADFRAISDRLGKEYQIQVLENPDDTAAKARVKGSFEGGVRIFMDKFVEDVTELPADAVISTPDEAKVRTYEYKFPGGMFLNTKQS